MYLPLLTYQQPSEITLKQYEALYTSHNSSDLTDCPYLMLIGDSTTSHLERKLMSTRRLSIIKPISLLELTPCKGSWQR